MDKKNLQFVLVETSHPGNIGAAARAMKNMGIGRLALVNPCDYQTYDCYARASGADELVDNATVYQDLASAVADSNLVVGTSARVRSLAWPQLSPRQAAAEVLGLTQESSASVVFGRERSGLTNEELALCSSLLVIPTDGAFSSLNIAAAVQVVAYEVMCATELPQQVVEDPTEAPADQAELHRFYDHLFDVMQQVDYLDPDNPRLLESRIRRLFNRTRPNRPELQLLRGFLSAVQKDIRKNPY